MGALESLYGWLGSKTWIQRLGVDRGLVPALDRRLLKAFGWRITPWPTALVTTVGRSSGQERTTPLYSVEEGDRLVVVGSNYGQAEPNWSRNLRADPQCWVTRKGVRRQYTAEIAPDEQAGRLYQRFVDFYPSYRAYEEVADREIPVWILVPSP